MKPVLINLTKKIILDNKTKDGVLKKIYNDSVDMVIYDMEYFAIETWDIATTPEILINDLHKRLNSDDNKSLKRLAMNYPGLPMGPDNPLVKVDGGKIQVLKGNLSDKKSFELALYLTLQEFTLFNSFGNSLLVAVGNQIENISKGVNTFLLELNGDYNIIHYRTIEP